MADFVFVGTELDLAYAAGIIDGEGSIGITEIKPDYEKSNRKHRRKSPQIRGYMSVVMTDFTIPFWFAEKFGGTAHSYPPRKEGQKGSTHWRIHGERCVEVCQILIPYLKIKRNQALTLVEMYTDKRLNFNQTKTISEDELSIRREYIHRIHTYNKRGE